MDDSAKRSKRTMYRTPYGRGNTANLDSLGYQYSLTPVVRRWGNFTEVTTAQFPKLHGTWKELSSSENTERFLSVGCTSLSYIPLGSDGLTHIDVPSGGIVLVERSPGSKLWTVLVPLPDVKYATAGDLI